MAEAKRQDDAGPEESRQVDRPEEEDMRGQGKMQETSRKQDRKRDREKDKEIRQGMAQQTGPGMAPEKEGETDQEKDREREDGLFSSVRSIRLEGKSNVKNSTTRVAFTVLLVALQFWWIYLFITQIEGNLPWLSTAISFASLILVLTVHARHLNSSYRMFWMIVIMAFPVLGIPFYALMGRHNSTKRMRRRCADLDRELAEKVTQDPEVVRSLGQFDPRSAGASNYLWKACGFPVYRNTSVRYFADAADAIDEQMRDMERARHFIFLEYFAVEEQGAFEPVREILKRKAAEGVEVRLLYDDIGSVSFLNNRFASRMEADGIHCRRFNPVVPVLNIFMNNRDHRKITVIDGKIGYTGGYNLANEYFHITQPFGYWKDAGVRLEGEAVRSLNLMVLETWNLMGKTEAAEDLKKYLPDLSFRAMGRGFVQPYADSPLDEEPTGEEVYMNMLRTAEHYVTFVTPYLILTDEMEREMRAAAKRGVEVKVITPGIPDKKMVYQETRSYYNGLVRGGVRIFEYTPGFCHAKLAVVDGRSCTVGTINLDYRSLYLHFEDGVLFHDDPIVDEVEKDIGQILASSREVTDRYRKESQTLPVRAVRALMRFLAPLL